MEHTEEQIEEQIIQTVERKKMTFTPEQLEKKRASMNKAREHRNKKITDLQTEIETLKKTPEPVLNTKKPIQRKPEIITRYECDDEEDDEEEIIERVIIRKKKPIQQKPELSKNDLVEKTYKEQLQIQLNNERKKRVMAELFDF